MRAARPSIAIVATTLLAMTFLVMTASSTSTMHDARVAAFAAPSCASCTGALKPRVVFFGENIAPDVLTPAWPTFDAADGLLILGSSLGGYAGRRFVDEAARRDCPVVRVKLEPTRADERHRLRRYALGAVGARLAAALGAPASW